jgi:hypothetical protein
MTVMMMMMMKLMTTTMMMMMNLEDDFLSLRNLQTILLTLSTFPPALSRFEGAR